MRNLALVRFTFLLFAAALPLATRAQFQPPTSEELKMTAEPKAPGADAIYLYKEDVTDDGMHFKSYYERIKVLTEKGKEMATVRIPYVHGVDKVSDIQGRTIHADGSIIPLTTKPEDLMDFKAKDYQVNTVVFTLPSVEVGSILEFRLMVRSPDNHVSQPTWDIQSRYFQRKVHYSFHQVVAPGHFVTSSDGDALTRLMYSFRLPTGAKVDYEPRRDTYSVDLTDVPPLPDDDWMPPLNTLRYRVEFYFTNAMNGPDFWQEAGKRWARRTNDFASISGLLKKTAADLVLPGDSDLQKAQKLYAAVLKLENTRFAHKKSEAERKKDKLKEIRNADDVWKQQSGSDDQIALLYVALARSAGLKAAPLQVVARNRAMFDARYLSTSQLDDYLAVVNIDGQDIYLDPGQKVCPFGVLQWKHALATGFRGTDKETVPMTTPGTNYKSAVVQRIADLTIDPAGAVTGSVRFVMNGPDAIHWRQLTLENDPDEVKKRFNESIKDSFPEGVQADFDHFLALDDYSVNLIAIVKISGTIGSATGKHFFLPGLLFESRSKHPFVASDQRTTPIDVHYPELLQDDVTYNLPTGFTVENAPQPTSAMWPDHAQLKIAFKVEPGKVTALRTLAYNFTLLDPKDYPALHDFYQKVATADQQQLVLTRTPPAKGN